VAIENNSADNLQLIVPNSAQALFGRDRDQSHGGAETRENVPRGMALVPMRRMASREWESGIL